MYNSFWYNSLTKPFLNPPSNVFPFVWGILYFMIFFSLMIFISSKSEDSKKSGYVYFLIQIFLNIIWSPIFFLMQNIGFALFIVILLDIFVILTIKSFYKISKVSAMLLIPYLIWIIFATYLNSAYFILNS